jgi:hypothetical protein
MQHSGMIIILPATAQYLKCTYSTVHMLAQHISVSVVGSKPPCHTGWLVILFCRLQTADDDCMRLITAPPIRQFDFDFEYEFEYGVSFRFCLLVFLFVEDIL